MIIFAFRKVIGRRVKNGDETRGQLGDYGSIPSFKNKNEESLIWYGMETDRFGRHLVGKSTRFGDKLGVRSEKGGVHDVSYLSNSVANW